jgi:hypothetical protein
MKAIGLGSPERLALQPDEELALQPDEELALQPDEELALQPDEEAGQPPKEREAFSRAIGSSRSPRFFRPSIAITSVQSGS